MGTKSNLKKFLDKFFNFKVVGKKVIIPYWMNQLENEIYGPFGGKGTPVEILEAIFKAAKEQNMDLHKMSKVAINSFMTKNRIGLDCSGFAYQILNFIDLERGGDGLENSVVGVGEKMGITKTNADALTNNTNSIAIENLQEVKTGDTVRFHGGKHVMVITEADEKQIEYAHISSRTKIKGPHLARIHIKDLSLGLEDQVWEEETKDGKNWKETLFSPISGDGVRRLKIFT
ncbi:MAG: hypothetical protein Q8Q15_00645 [bacterium]|nr:hypothetical protein [bacterium]